MVTWYHFSFMTTLLRCLLHSNHSKTLVSAEDWADWAATFELQFHCNTRSSKDECIALFDMPNLNRFDILSISIFCKISLSILIFPKSPYRYRYFPKSPYQYRYRYWYFWNCPIDIDIDIDIFNFSISISISIFFKSVDISTIDISYRYFNKEKE